MRVPIPSLLLALVFGCGGSTVEPAPAPPPAPPAPSVAAERASPEPAPPVLAIDTHVDTTQRMLDESADLTTRLEGGHLDFPRMREGGLSGAFFSIWVDPAEYRDDAAWERALALIAAVRRTAELHPDAAVVATTAEEVRSAAESSRIAMLMGIEGAHALGASDPDTVLARLREAYALGVRYMTITWSTDNPLGHSSTGAHPELGLTELGRRVVAEMNRLGMIVDVSHVGDQTFADILAVTTRPVLASHSSCRALADHPRNMTDDMIRQVSAQGGAVCINYNAGFIDLHHAERRPTVSTLGEHFAHAADVGGAGAVCLGSDFDGIHELPVGLDDVAHLPALRAELEARGLDVPAIFGQNVLRVLAAQSDPAQP